jgi:hypothetical protein
VEQKGRSVKLLTPKRWRTAIATLGAAGLAAAGLTMAAPGVAHASTQIGPFPVGNLLSYTNSDFEGSVGDWAPSGSSPNAVVSLDTSNSVMHKDSLLDTAPAAGRSRFRPGGAAGTLDITLPVPGGEYRVGAYFKAPAVSGQTVYFALHCFTSGGSDLGFTNGSTITLNSSGNWQYAEDDITVPSGCSYVEDSPGVILDNLAAGAKVNMDYVIFAPHRAAVAIGAHGDNCGDGNCTGNYSSTDWSDSNQSIGPFQTDKEFNDGLTTFSATNCAGDEAAVNNDPSKFPVCIIAYKSPFTSQPAMDAFLQTVPANQEVILVWHQEPEGDTFNYCNETGAAAFKCETEQQAAYVHGSRYDTPNILIAQDSAGSWYVNNTSCSWITPSSSTGSGVDLYLEDHYENTQVDGTNVNTETDGGHDYTRWQHWLKCASPQNRPLGFGEYGLDNSPIRIDGPSTVCNQPSHNGHTNASEVQSAQSADNSYLEALPMSGDPNLVNPEPFLVWNYWYTDYGGTAVCDVFNNTHGAITEWQSIENQNGGQVGG